LSTALNLHEQPGTNRYCSNGTYYSTTAIRVCREKAG
jgi:hypothetical protein